MSNPLRLLHKNIAKITGITASSAEAGYPASELLKASKDTSFRATGTSVTLSGSSATPLTAAGLILARCNLSPTATGRFVAYSDQAGTVPVLDTTAKLVCPAPSVELEGWTAAQAASAYAYGGGTDAALWFNSTTFRKWEFTISDASNLQGYIEACYLMLGPTFSPSCDLDENATFTMRSTDVQVRTAAGSLASRAGIKYREQPLDLTEMTAADRQELMRLLRSAGRHHPVGLCLFPDDDDLELMRDTTLVCKLTEDAELTLKGMDSFASLLRFAEI